MELYSWIVVTKHQKTCIRSKPKKYLKLDHSIHHGSIEIKIENKLSILKEYL